MLLKQKFQTSFILTFETMTLQFKVIQATCSYFAVSFLSVQIIDQTILYIIKQMVTLEIKVRSHATRFTMLPFQPVSVLAVSY